MAGNTVQAVPGLGRMSLIGRLGIAAAALTAEKFLLNFQVDFQAAQTVTGAGAVLRVAQHLGLRLAVTSAAALSLLGFLRGGAPLRKVNAAARDVPWRVPALLLHAVLLAPLAWICSSLFDSAGPSMSVLIALGLAVTTASVAALLAAMAPWCLWRAAAAALGPAAWTCALLAGGGAALAMQWSQMLWRPAARITFALVTQLLLPLLPQLHADSTTLVLDTGRFAVEVSYLCSGLEGLGLMLAFCAAWLVYFRNEYRFPRALLIIPLGLGTIFVLNVLRLAALILIGHVGFADVAVYGFHSQAGWMAFTATACGIAYASRRNPWFGRGTVPDGTGRDSAGRGGARTANPTAAWLMPFLAILAAGMASHAASGRFETFYPLRLAVALLALWYYRTTLKALDWRFSWRGPLAGVAVAILWLAAAHFFTAPAGEPSGLALMSPAARTGWITARTLAAVITVPIAEELAYRGYLMRRIESIDFESVPFRTVRWQAVLATSILFGAAHGALWLPGIAAGLVYGLVTRTGRLGEAVMAHAATNAVIAASVLAYGQWQLW